MSRSLRTLAVGTVAAAAALGGVLAAAGPAVAAAPPGTFEIDYDASGASHLAKPNTDVALGPTTLVSYISDSGDGTFTGSLPLPTTTASFKAFGFVPLSAKVSFVPAGPVTGTLSTTVPTTVTATAKYYIKLTDAKAAGLPAFVGDKCQTAAPVTIPVATPAGEAFDLTNGGTLAGTYTIGDFANCGLTTALINNQVPGAGNTVRFTVSNGRFVG